MTLVLRPASAKHDQEQMVNLQTRNVPYFLEGRFEWRHFANPAGPAWSWFLCEKSNSPPVAMASVFPTFMFVDGRRIVGGQVGEFVVDAEYRSMGPALMLQRATFGPVDSRAIGICYDCPPDDLGMATFKRLGMQADTEVFRYALPLRSDEFLRKKLGRGPLTKAAITTANMLLGAKLSIRGNRKLEGLEISEFDGMFDDEFDRLDQTVSSAGTIRASRSAEILNWRYKNMPRCSYLTLIARRAGELLGFLTAIDNNGRIGIGEVFGHRFDEVSVALLDALVSRCRKAKAHLVEGYSSESSPSKVAFLRVGLTRRERVARIVAYEKTRQGGKKMVHPGIRWAFAAVETIV